MVPVSMNSSTEKKPVNKAKQTASDGYSMPMDKHLLNTYCVLIGFQVCGGRQVQEGPLHGDRSGRRICERRLRVPEECN